MIIGITMSITQLSHQSLPSHTKLNGIFPQEVLYQIFNFADLSRKDLKACGLVCKLWNQVSTHNRLWYKCCIKELSLKMEKNRFESININTFSYSVDYKNLYNKFHILYNF